MCFVIRVQTDQLTCNTFLICKLYFNAAGDNSTLMLVIYFQISPKLVIYFNMQHPRIQISPRGKSHHVCQSCQGGKEHVLNYTKLGFNVALHVLGLSYYRVVVYKNYYKNILPNSSSKQVCIIHLRVFSRCQHLNAIWGERKLC